MSEDHPSAWQSLTASLRGEVDAGVLEAFRRAGATVYDMVDETAERRRILHLRGVTPWQTPLAVQAEGLATWNAFVLQVLGDRLLLEDYEVDPSTVGFVPQTTLTQAERFYSRVSPWLVAARMAHANREYRLPVDLPVPMPKWLAGPRPPTHVEVMYTVGLQLVARVDLAMDAYDDGDDQRPHREAQGLMREMVTEALTRLDYVGEILTDLPERLRARVDNELQRALVRLSDAGQYVAMPGLLRDQL